MARVRCFDCGRLVDMRDVVRRDVRTAETVDWGGRGGADTYSRVDLCRPCLRRRNQSEMAALRVALAVILAIFAIAILTLVGVGIRNALGLGN